MDKRAAKRFKRQVARAKEHVKLSEPDVRTHEQIVADREASQHGYLNATSGPAIHNPTMSKRNPAAIGSASKTSA